MRKAKNGNKKAEAASKEEERKTEVSDNINKCKALKTCHINSLKNMKKIKKKRLILNFLLSTIRDVPSAQRTLKLKEKT